LLFVAVVVVVVDAAATAETLPTQQREGSEIMTMRRRVPE